MFSGSDCEIVGPQSVVRDWSGVCNNVDNPYGSAGTKLFRVGSPDFGNGVNSPGGSVISARHISNIVCREGKRLHGGKGRHHPMYLDICFFYRFQRIQYFLIWCLKSRI